MTDEDLTQLLALDAAPGPALAMPPADADALIARALAGAGFPPPGGGPGHGGAAPAVRGGLATGTKVALAALAVTAAVVIALLVLRRAHATLATPADALIDAATDAATDAPPGAAAAPAPAATHAIVVDAAPARVPAAEVDGSGSAAPAGDDVELDPPPARPAPAHPAESREPADLLGEANARRAANEWRESDALYARVVRRAPHSLAAQTALVASGSIHLEHLGDPRGAADRFRRALALAPAGALAEEARWGLAEAARARHDTAAEARALDDFLAHHPGSPLAPRARARRSELP